MKITFSNFFFCLNIFHFSYRYIIYEIWVRYPSTFRYFKNRVFFLSGRHGRSIIIKIDYLRMSVKYICIIIRFLIVEIHYNKYMHYPVQPKSNDFFIVEMHYIIYKSL